MPSLSSFDMFLDSTNLLLSLLDEINAVVSPFSRFNPVQRSSTLAAIQRFEWSHLDAFLITIIIGKFSQG